MSQLQGSDLTESDLSECEPIVLNKDLGKTESWDGVPLDMNAPANPCGLVAASFFNDTYEILDKDSNPVKINSENIAWQSDKFSIPDNSNKVQWIKTDDPHFMVWMRTAGMPNFRKLWG